TGAFLPGLRWSRASYSTTNLHHLLGFWISIPLAVVSVTGIYLGFPHTAREAMSSIATMAPQGQRPGFGPIARDARLSPDAALATGRASQPGGRAAALFLPTANASGRGRGGAGDGASKAGPVWRVQLRTPQNGEIVTVMVDDRSGAVELQPAPLS